VYRSPVIARLGQRLSQVAAQVVPDPFVLALGLTVVVGAVAAALLLQDGVEVAAVPGTLFEGWARGFADPPLLAFALQICLVLVTGHALALSPPVQAAVAALARVPRSAGTATLLVGLVACLAAVIHWGLGAVVGALVAREIGRHAAARGTPVHYPLLGAAAYTGLAVWHGGVSGTAPLKVAEPAHFAVEVAGVVPIEQTLLSPLNLLVTGTLVIGIPLLCWAMTPSDPEALIPPPPLPPPPAPARPGRGGTVPDRLLESAVPGVLVGATGLLAVGAALAGGRLGFDLDAVNLLFLFLGILCQARLRAYLEAVVDGARGAGAVILQFPFYFGILGMMKVSGAIAWLSAALTDLAGPQSFPAIAFASASLVNFFVPSGGGQWAVQGEILLGAGAELGVAPGMTVMAFAYGDACTNMVQPFWALPLLGIMGLRARDILGYTTVVCLAVAAAALAFLLVAA
jgi:short-chain fatty acids transporter